jgi:hypothetical protein
MKNIKLYILIILALFSISSCHGENSQADEACGKQVSKALGHINNFYFTKQTAYLDSALQILKSIENKSLKYKYTIFSDEVHAYFLKKDFATALITLDKVPDSLYAFPAFKNILENKIRAKEAENKGDSINKKKFFRALISIYQSYIDDNYQSCEAALRQPEVKKVNNTQIDFILTELYYYISKTEGINNAVNKLENFQQKINGNSLYFNNLKKLIKENNANSMNILLY